jgi:hypothetical protein
MVPCPSCHTSHTCHACCAGQHHNHVTHVCYTFKHVTGTGPWPHQVTAHLMHVMECSGEEGYFLWLCRSLLTMICVLLQIWVESVLCQHPLNSISCTLLLVCECADSRVASRRAFVALQLLKAVFQSALCHPLWQSCTHCPPSFPKPCGRVALSCTHVDSLLPPSPQPNTLSQVV